MRVGFSGNRRGLNPDQKAALVELLQGLNATEWHDGDCVGADLAGRTIALHLKLRVVSHPPINDSQRAFAPFDVERRPAPYLQRNWAIVQETHCLIAVPGSQEEVLRSGTWATIRYARRLKRPRFIIMADGSIDRDSPPGHQGAEVVYGTTSS